MCSANCATGGRGVPAPKSYRGALRIKGDDPARRRREQAWRIVGEDEADPAAGSLAYVAPLARALMGRRVGDLVELAGNEVEITKIAN